jgi:hypothetical protein
MRILGTCLIAGMALAPFTALGQSAVFGVSASETDLAS